MIAALLALALLAADPPTAAASPPAAETDQAQPSAKASRGPLTAAVRLTGRVWPQRQVIVEAPEIAQMGWLAVQKVADEGAPVRADEPVVSFDRALHGRLLDKAEGRVVLELAHFTQFERTLALEQLELSLEVERADLAVRRAALLAVEGPGPALQNERAKIDLKQAELAHKLALSDLEAFEKRRPKREALARQALAQAEREVDALKAALGRLELRAPQAGLVVLIEAQTRAGRKLIEVGDEVRPGAPLLAVADPSQLEARFFANLAELAGLKPGEAVSLAPIAATGKSIAGKVQALESSCLQKGCGFTVRVAIEKTEGDSLVPGVGVLLERRITLEKNALLIPLSAVVASRGASAVWCLDNPIGWRKVVVGRTSGDMVEIKSGLEEGSLVSLAPLEAAGKIP